MPSTKTHLAVYEHVLLTNTIDQLIYNQFASANIKDYNKIVIKPEDLKKCVWLASILASSTEEAHQKKAQQFASLVTLLFPENDDILRACYIIYSRLGNLTATRFLPGLFTGQAHGQVTSQFKNQFGTILDFEVALAREMKTISIGSEFFLTTNFQKHLWDGLAVKGNISISGPTSSGKSFIIKKFIQRQFAESAEFSVLYIVPSRALINQVSEEFRVDCDLENVNIMTAYLDPDQKEAVDEQPLNRSIYVLTPERCLRLLQSSWKNKIPLDFIFADEIQNIEDEQGRGNLLEYILRELAMLYSQSKFIIAGPNIDHADRLFNKIFNLENIPVATSVSPVFQIRVIIQPTDTNIVNVRLKTYSRQDFVFPLSTDFNLKKSFDKNIGTAMANLVNLFGKKGQNIIYSPQTDWVESWALEFAESRPESEDLDPQLNQLIEFLEDEIHVDYFLINCLKKKCAFHHSKLPDIVRKEIEDLFLLGKIGNLFCTSTLLEGVNLPANNLFIIIPKKNDIPLSSFEFGNLAGRAGRIRDSLYGTIFCIEKDNIEWTDKYFNSLPSKEVLPASEKALFQSKSLLSNISKPIHEIEQRGDANATIFFRHQFIKSEDEILTYLQNKNLDNEQIDNIIAQLKSSLSEISTSNDLLRLNPGIDPVLQNTLYRDIAQNGIKKWLVKPNANFFRRIRRINLDEYDADSLSLFWQMERIVTQLDQIFKLSDEAWRRQKISLSIAQMCVYGNQWMENRSYKELIENDINFHAAHTNPDKRIDPTKPKDVNKRINAMIKINSSIVTYILVKYLKLLNDLLVPQMTDEEIELHKFSLALPVMLELGTTEPIVIQLLSKGVSRSVALKIFQQFKVVPNYKEKDVFTWLKENETIGLKNIYERYLKALRLLKTGA